MSGSLSLYVFLIASAALSARAATIVSEDFDALTAQTGVTSAGVFHAVGGTNVDIVGPANGYGALCATPASGNCIDLDGSGGNPQGILQLVTPITLQPGFNYLLSFNLIGSGRGVTTSTTVTFGSYSQTFVLASNDVTSGIVNSQVVTVSSPLMTNLVFQSNTSGEVGAVLDNVSIVSIFQERSPVPEPGTAGLVLVLGAGAFFMKRRG
jgi:hypothetical protein